MSVFRFKNSSHDVFLDVPEGEYKLTGEHDDLQETVNGVLTPLVRNGIAQDGTCTVIVEDGGSHSQTLEVIQSLRSGIGVGDYTVYNDDVPCSYLALVDVDIVSDAVMRAVISWKGTINSTED